MLCTNSPWLIYSWLEPCTFHLAKHPMLDPHVLFNAQHLFLFLRISLLSSYQAAKTQSNTLCSSFITCSISSDFMGGLEYWPERRPCPNLALWGRKWQGGNKCEKNRKAEIFIPSKKEVYCLWSPDEASLHAIKQANLPTLVQKSHFQDHAEVDFFCITIKLFQFYLIWQSKTLRSVTYIWVLKSCVGSRGE